MDANSLFRSGRYSLEWVKSFYSQARLWWGPDVQGQMVYDWRAASIERLCGPVEYIEADFYTVDLEGRFDVVCYWDGFGVGSDADQRRILGRIAREWLVPGGTALVDVFHPARFSRHAGEEEILPPLPGVPDSVEMLHRTHFDPLHCRWIDEWIPTACPEQALAQTLRCYSIPDFQLLLEGTGLRLGRVEVGDEVIDFHDDSIHLSNTLMETYSYLAVMESGS